MNAHSLTDMTDLLADVSAVSPSAPVSMAASPEVLAGTSGGVSYDASSLSDQLYGWQPPIRSADADMLPEKFRIDARSRDMLRNDAYVAGGADIHKNSIVGARYQLNAQPVTKELWGKDDPVWEEEFQEEVETKFTLWAESPQNWTDAARINTLSDDVRLAIGCFLSYGEVLKSAEWMPDDGRQYRSATLMIDPDRLSKPQNSSGFNAPNIRSGVERDFKGAPIAYHIRNTHPSDGQFTDYTRNDLFTWRRVPTRKPWGRQMVLHLYEQMRPDQSRGVSQMVGALSEMRMTRQFRKTELQRAIIAATYAASIESDIPADAAMAMGTGNTDDESAYMAYVREYLSAQGEYANGGNNLHLAGAKIPIFFPNTHLKIQNPGASSPSGDKFEASLNRHIAAALGISYEEFSRDYSNTNYSSARASLTQTVKAMNAKKKKVGDATANFTYRLWLEECVNYGTLECLKRPNVPRFYDGLNSDAYSNCDWVGAGRGQIDPLKETQAAILRIQNGLSTQEREASSISGDDWRKIKRQAAREMQMDADLKLPSIYDKQSANQNMTNSLTATPSDGSSK